MTGVTQVFEASSAYQIMVLTAAIDADLFPAADRRLLLLSANTSIPEVARRIDSDPTIAVLLTRFDTIASYNDLIAPLHPTEFRPREGEALLFQRAFRRELRIPDDHVVELALESIQAAPARTIMNVFADSPITVYAEGLMSYGPTRDRLTGAMSSRVTRLLYLDLLRDLTPMLLTEYGVPSQPIPDAAFRAVVSSLLADGARDPDAEPYALVLGQYLADLDLVTAAEEAQMYSDLIGAAAAQGIRRIVFKPHPSAPPRYAETLRRRATASGVALEIERRPIPVEVLYDRDPPALVLGCFSTGLVTASRYWSIPTAAIGTESVLASLPRAEDSNRIPLVLVDRTVPRVVGSPNGTAIAPAVAPSRADLQDLVHAVGYAMQWQAHRARRQSVLATLRRRTIDLARFVPRRRIRMLALPGGSPIVLDAAAFDSTLELLRAFGEQRLRVATRLSRIIAWPRVPRREAESDF